ncbi:zinc ribbon domain-containing protein [Micromonospora sp. NBC_01699]|uniref:zinc-ribbon domain-containing protein n=1 Tax=Micromonospora sp. NBC_01699 TaxID=2975984 RepID=UPI002E30CB07|nr:zinc-ribbon domain-containing protein [Micromonospora sp. NBC_01699]
MFLIFGWRTKAQLLGTVLMACRVCGQPGNLLVVREVTRLSLFFIPLIPIRTKYVVRCANPYCGAGTGVSADEARRLLATGAGSTR